MKRIIFITIFITISIFSFAQNDYYWSAGKKHYLTEDTNIFIVKFVGETKNVEQKIQSLRSVKEIKHVTSIKDNLGIVVAGGHYIKFRKTQNLSRT